MVRCGGFLTEMMTKFGGEGIPKHPREGGVPFGGIWGKGGNKSEVARIEVVRRELGYRPRLCGEVEAKAFDRS
jgi:hypothetical protein